MVDNFEQYFKINPNAFRFSQKLNKNIAKSVHFKDRERFSLAKEQKDKPTVSVSDIIKLVNDLLESVGIKTVEEKQAKMNPNEVNYDQLKEKYHLADERDIVWLKFTKSGHVGVVASSNDIGFDIPQNESEYNTQIKVYNKFEKCYEVNWKYTTSGILVHSVKEKWDESFVLVFPLESNGKPCRYNRHEIEIAIGNYLEKNNVPIIDYYSHNY